MFASIAHSCSATAALTSSQYDYAAKLGSLKSVFCSGDGGDDSTSWPQNLNWIVTDRFFTSLKSPLVRCVSGLSHNQCDIAFLQYTSGSTSDPKGVMITQQNLSDNLRLIVTGLNASDDTVVVSWLPQYHDMGLIGSYLGALYCGGCGYYLSPLAFIRNPSLWVQAMSKYKATHIQAPNFAYALTARKYLAQGRNRVLKKDSTVLDLSSVRHMINAGTVTALAICVLSAICNCIALRCSLYELGKVRLSLSLSLSLSLFPPLPLLQPSPWRPAAWTFSTQCSAP
jgi:acyl-CoA synthetase (AMP-forming)/AMP-acid ligase II